MATVENRGAAMRGVRAMVAACHPLPTAAVTAFAVGLAVAANASPTTVVLLGAAVLTGQLSVGWSNDWLDVVRDRAAGRRDKPAATGAVAPGTLRAASLVVAAACVVASLATGAVPGVLHLAAVASAWAYNAGLKRTPVSWLPYAVSFGLLPAFVLAAAGDVASPALVATGALLGVGAHVTNVLPDLDDDVATGVRGLPHRIGRRASSVAAPALLAAAVVVVVARLPDGAGSGAAVAVAVGAVALAVAAGAVGLVRPASRAPFALSMGVAAACVALLVTSGPRLR